MSTESSYTEDNPRTGGNSSISTNNTGAITNSLRNDFNEIMSISGSENHGLVTIDMYSTSSARTNFSRTSEKDAGSVGNYSQLILIQHSPITSFFAPLQNQRTSADEIVEYLRGHFMVFNAQRWVVHGLWAIDSNAVLLTKCETSTGTQPTYNHENMNDDFIDDLVLIWPILIPNGLMEEDLWGIEYNTYGSCVTTSEITYFDLASRLMAFRNIGGILHRSGIVPGTSYPLNRIVTSITNFLRKRVYIICIPAQNNREQYLLGVELCFDRLSELTDCYQSGSHYCDIDKTIMYPGRPRH